jgi:HEPN domain-containing protein
MSDEVGVWLNYAEENLRAAKVLRDSLLCNPCLQNVQQSVEKALKSSLLRHSLDLIRTHSIRELYQNLSSNGVALDLTEDECDFLDSIYLPSKYPLHSVLPDFEPDEALCDQGIGIAERVLHSVRS